MYLCTIRRFIFSSGRSEPVDIRRELPEDAALPMAERSAAETNLPKSEQVCRRIKHLIMHHVLKPGQKIPEDELAGMLQTSRTPVREALRKLSGEGLVTIYPKRYAEVTYFTPEMARSLGAVRMSQDVLSGRLAIYHGSDADFAGLRQLAETCEAAAAAGDLYGRITADRDFHLRITELGQNELLLRYQREVYLRIHLLQLQYVSLEDDAAGRAACHSALVDALCRRDEAAYTRAICRRCQEMYGLDPQIVSLYTR